MKRSPSHASHAIDWDGVRTRLARAERALQEALEPGPEAIARRLQERARALARREDRLAPHSAGSETGRSALALRLAGRRLLLPIDIVHGVARTRQLARVPSAPELLLGVARVRGRLLPAIDLCRLLDMGRTGLSDLGWMVLLGREAPELVLLADEVLGQAELAAPASRGQGSGIVHGVDGDGSLQLDGHALLDDPRLFFSS